MNEVNFKKDEGSKIKLFTVGFTNKKADKFFNILKTSGVKRILDIRLNNVSQLAGFAKRDDLKYFLKRKLNPENLEEVRKIIHEELAAYSPRKDLDQLIIKSTQKLSDEHQQILTKLDNAPVLHNKRNGGAF